MKKDRVKIEAITHEIPWDLFLIADPSKEVIAQHLQNGIQYIDMLRFVLKLQK